MFDPIHPAHAIERCSASFVFDETVPEKMLIKIREQANVLFGAMQLIAQPQPNIGFQIDAGSGAVTPFQGGIGNLNYTNADRSTTCVISPSSISWTSSAYVRWQPFVGQIEQYVLPIISTFDGAVSLNVVKLEYFDRFFWNGTWDDFDSTALLRFDRGMIADHIKAAAREFHSHIGWFDNIQETSRRLVNVNINGTTMARPGETGVKPSVQVHTMIQDQKTVPENTLSTLDNIDLDQPLARLEEQHIALKDLLAEVITSAMADRITLNPRS